MRKSLFVLSLPLAALLALASPQPANAQKWEFGGLGGGSFYSSRTVTSAAGATASAGFSPGISGGVYLGQNVSDRFGGEVRYLLQLNDLRLKSGGDSVTFGGQTHTFHYDLLVYTSPATASVRPFVAVGGGGKYFRGTGTEAAFQPLSNFAILSKTNQWTGLVDFGAGVKIQAGRRTSLRAEFRDYVTPFPDQVIVPVPGANVGGWIHNFMFLFGIGVTF